MDFSKLLYGFVKIDTWMSQSCYMNLSRFLHMFYVFLALGQKKTKLKFDQAFKAC